MTLKSPIPVPAREFRRTRIIHGGRSHKEAELIWSRAEGWHALHDTSEDLRVTHGYGKMVV
jgi:hypothetical protein